MKQSPTLATMPLTSRVIIHRVYPEIDGGRYPIKRTPGEWVTVEADIFADGVDPVSAEILTKKFGAKDWKVVRMSPLENDRYRGEFKVEEIGEYLYTIQGRIEYTGTWRQNLRNGKDSTPPTLYDKELRVRVDRAKSRFSTWYEVFPRSTSSTPGKHGTFRDCIARLPY